MRIRFKSLNLSKVKKASRGAITLFLAVLLMPFVTLALILVQTAQYNSALSALDEALGLSANATLANYDEFLQRRFGLYAVDQSNELEDVFTSYSDVNAQILGSTIDVSRTTAKGLYPLSDSNVLLSQLMEFGKLAAPTELLVEALNIQEIIDSLRKMIGGGAFDSLLTILDSGLKTANSMAAAFENLDKALESAIALEATGPNSLQGKYDNAYEELEDAVKALSEVIAEAPPVPARPKINDYSSSSSHQEALDKYKEENPDLNALREDVDAKKQASKHASFSARGCRRKEAGMLGCQQSDSGRDCCTIQCI